MKRLLLAIALLCGLAQAQVIVGNYGVLYVVSAPSGACVATAAIQVVVGAGTIWTCQTGTWTQVSGGGGGVTSVGLQINGGASSGIFAVSGSPVTTTGNLNYNLTGTSGGIPYFSSASVLSTSAALTANGVVLGGGAGVSPTVTTADSTTTHALFATAGAPAFRALATTDEPSAVVQTGKTNVFGAFLNDFSGSTMEIPESAAFVSTVDSTIGIDTNTGIMHLWGPGSADSFNVVTSSTSTTTTQVVHATATAGLYVPSAIATGDLPTSGIPNVAYLNAGNVYTSAGTGDFRSASATAGLAVPVASGAAPLVSGFLAFDSNINVFSVGNNGTRTNLAVAGIGAGGATTCTNQVVTVISGTAAPTCTSLGTSFGVLMNNVLNTGTAGFQIDGSASTAGNPFKTQSKAGATATAAGAYTYDSTTGLFHLATNAVDATAITAPARVSATAQTAAISTATLCTAAQCPANPGHYEVHWEFTGGGTACSSVSAGSVTFLLTWTDENAVTHSAVALQMQAQTGAATTAMGGTFPFQTALANEGASGTFSVSTNGTIIQYATGYTACTTGTGTYSLRAEVTRMQ